MQVREARAMPAGREPKAWESLTPTERRVIELLCEGLSNPRIAERMYISRRTVSTHLYRIFKKLGVSSRSELVAKAVARRHRNNGRGRRNETD